MGNCGCFWFFCLTVCFHSIPFCPPFSIHHATTLHHHALTHPTTVHTTPHHGTHNTPRNHACVLWCLLFACRCLCVSLSARSFLTQPKPRHAIQSPYPPHMAPPMHEPMSEWEGAVVCVWTPQPKHQPPQPSHDATHTTCSLSFHPLAIHTLHNTTTPTLTPCDRTCPTPTHLLTFQQHTGFEAHT